MEFSHLNPIKIYLDANFMEIKILNLVWQLFFKTVLSILENKKKTINKVFFK